MEFTPTSASHIYEQGKSRFSFLLSGDIYEFVHSGFLLNGFLGNLKGGAANNLWLRLYHDNKICFYPLLGIQSASKLEKSENGLCFSGTVAQVNYSVRFLCRENAWFWDVALHGEGEIVDLVYGQDIGLAEKNAVLENELYTAQYLGHTIFENENGYVVCSRQNMAQNGKHPFLQQGMVNGKAIAYSTDAMQFFGREYKAAGIACALSGNLENRNLQFECTYIALQSEKMCLDHPKTVTFYGFVQEHHAGAVEEAFRLEDMKRLFAQMETVTAWTPIPAVRIKPEFGGAFVSPQWNEERVFRLFPSHRLEERAGGELLSFFTDGHAHVALMQKELLCERPHGNIITTRVNTEQVDNRLITSTNYIHGLFNGQTVIGNTSKHKLLSAPRGLLDFLKNGGQRLWVRIGGVFQLLSLPSVFEMGLNYSRWYYEVGGDLLIISAFAVCDSTEIVLDVKSRDNALYDFILTNQLVMGNREFENSIRLQKVGGVLRITQNERQAAASPYSDLHYDLHLPGTEYTFGDDSLFFEDGVSQNTTLLSICINAKSAFQLIIHGSLESSPIAAVPLRNFEAEKRSYLDFYSDITAGFSFFEEGLERNALTKLNETIFWYTHNALVHFAVPHGLEQPGGAAWGTRDISQGPMEFFLATQNFKLARSVLLNVFSHQSALSGEWPQWFMFDRYRDCLPECHGDVVFWPLKCVGDYLNASGDTGILRERLPYLEGGEKHTLLSHIKFAVSRLPGRFLPGTQLISYAGGDWDDTLQPASEELKNRLVSSWTQALAYQVLHLLSETICGIEDELAAFAGRLADDIKKSFLKYLLFDGVIAGFAYRSPSGDFQPMLHPFDTETGIHYRLLPMTRSIIADLADKELAAVNIKLIEEKLHCPDGVRLMDRPASYSGGVSRLFKRAEQAANVGREVSLQYTHAHIRYIEAMCHLGRADAVWKGLFEINPIGIQEVVPNALYRQSNLYFSSSEGAFFDRYEYSRDFEKLFDGSIKVKGGWRLYSSGPGIYLGQLISNVAGIRFEGGSLTVDPVLTPAHNGLRLRFSCFGKMHTFLYHVHTAPYAQIAVTQNDKELPITRTNNPYRAGGAILTRDSIDDDCEEIHIWLS